MALNNRVLWLLFLPAVFYLQSCNTDKLPDPNEPSACDSLTVTYDLDIKPIIDASCAYAGCHVAGASIGNFSSYEGILPLLNFGEVERRVVTLQANPAEGMPPDIYVASSTLADLNDTDFELFRCWLENGYPEN